jgi:hypothetical protein
MTADMILFWPDTALVLIAIGLVWLILFSAKDK